MTAPAVTAPPRDELDQLFQQYGPRPSSTSGGPLVRAPRSASGPQPRADHGAGSSAGDGDELDSLYRQFGGASAAPSSGVTAPSSGVTAPSSGGAASATKGSATFDNALMARGRPPTTAQLDNVPTKPDAAPPSVTQTAPPAPAGPTRGTPSLGRPTVVGPTPNERAKRPALRGDLRAPTVSSPPIPPAAPADVTRSPASPSTHGVSTARALGLDDASFPGRLANALGGMAAHPMQTAEGFVTAPVEAAMVLARASAEQDAANALATSGGDPSTVERTVTPKQAAVAAGQIAALGLAGPLGRVASSMTARFLGETAANVVGSAAAGAGVGAVYSPDDPAVGAAIGAAAGGAHAVIPESAAGPTPPRMDEPRGVGGAVPETKATTVTSRIGGPPATDRSGAQVETPLQASSAATGVPEPKAPPTLTPAQMPASPEAPTHESVAGAAGRATRVLLRDGQTLAAEYRVVSADDVRSSHDPFTFLPTPSYPEGVQGRDYQRNTSAQEAVAHRSLSFNANLALNPSETAGEGAPTILPDGTVLAGNERSMLVRRSAVFAPDRYAEYVRQLKERAPDFGIDPREVDRVESPMLVRVLSESRDVAGGPTRWAEINRLSDEVSTKAKSAVEEGAARAGKLARAPNAMQHLAATLEPEQTVSDYLGTPNGRAFVLALKSEGVITPEEFSRLTDGHGAVTEDGRAAVRRMLLSTAVTEPSVLLDAPASAASKLEHAVPAIVSTRGTPFDIAPVTTAALRMVAEAHDHGMSVRDLAGQSSLFGEHAHDRMTVALADALETDTPSVVKAAFRRYAVLARESLSNRESGDMFGGTGFNTPADAFHDAFKTAIDRTSETASPARAASAPTAEAADSRTFFDRIPVEKRGTAGHPTRAGELLAEARDSAQPSAPREVGAGPALTGARAPDPVDDAARGVNRFTDALRKVFAPASRGEDARLTALATREHDAALVHRYEQAKESLKEFGRQMDRLPVRDQLDFIDRLETGRSQRTPELGQPAATIRKLLDDARDAIRALGTGQLEHWVENYFPHIWADPERARNVVAAMMGKRSLTGPGSFLKKRSIPTIREGMDRGLVPVTTNPIDLTLLKLREMHRYLAGQRIVGELKENGLLRFVSSFEKAPDGYRLLDDKISTVYGPPTVTVHEAYDHFIRTGLEDVLSQLGVEHERRARIGVAKGGGLILGAAQGDAKIMTRSATDLSVLEHELGHILDARFGLWDALHRDDAAPAPEGPSGLPTREQSERRAAAAKAYSLTIDQELRQLADLRHEGVEHVSPSAKAYVQSKEERIANAVMGLMHAPERLREVAPTVDARLRAILARDPVTARLLDIKPSFRHAVESFEVGAPGMVVLGHYYAPEPAARVLNNYTSPGLSQSPIGPFFDVYRGAGNLLNMIQLGFSGFHAMFTALDAAVSRNALGILQGREAVKRLVGGDVPGAAKRGTEALTSFATSPAAPITNAIKGSRVRQAYLRGTDDPVLAQIIDGLEAGGGRVKMDEFYGGTAWRQFRLALHESRYGTAAGKVLPAAIEKSSAWLMEHVVPFQKLGVFYDLAQLELSKLPAGADRTQVRTAMARAWDSVDNRLGQLTYNNLFWHRWLKDGLMASVRSVGWNVGSVRELGGGAVDVVRAPLRSSSPLAPEAGERAVLTPRASYVLALPLTVGLAGGVLQFLYTGQAPSSLKDWFYPRTGMKNPDGSDERVQLASYLRDVRDVTSAPWQAVKNKENPALRLGLDMLNNADYFGDESRNPADPLVRQADQEARYILDQAAPLGVTNVASSLKRGEPVGRAAQSLVGITPAPRDVMRSPALARMNEILRTRVGGPRTPEQREASQERTDLVGRLRRHETDAGTTLAGAVESGQVTSAAAKRALTSSASPAIVERFKQLTLPEALEVFKLATPDERRQFSSALTAKLSRAKAEQYNASDVQKIRRTLDDLQREPSSSRP